MKNIFKNILYECCLNNYFFGGGMNNKNELWYYAGWLGLP